MVKVLTCSTPYYSCGNFIVVTMQEILVISATDFFDVASRRHNDIILLPAIRRVSGNDFVFQQGSAPAQRAEHVQQLSVGVKKRQTFLRPTCGLQIAEISVLWITRSGLSCSIVSTTDESIVWMNWNGGSSMSGAVLNSRFLRRLLTSSEEDIERVSTLKEGISVQLVNWQCWFCPYLLHSMWFVWLLHL